MGWLRFFRRSRWDAERSRELLAHLEIEMDDNIARGMSPDDARAAAYRTLGNPTLVREEIYGMNSISWLETAWQDLKYAFRVLRQSPSFSVVALLSLALGIGANTAIFQLINAVKLRTLPLPHAERIVEYRIETHGKGRTGQFNGDRPMMSYPIYERLSQQPGLGRVFAWGTAGWDLADGGESQPARGLYVSGTVFGAAGVRPAAGRLIAPSDDTRGCGTPAAVLNYAFWQSKFGGDLNILGKPLKLNGNTFLVAGVTEAAFFGFEVGRSFDVAIPICAEPLLRTRSVLANPEAWWLSIMARLDDGESLASAEKTAASISTALFGATLPPNYRQGDADSYKAFGLLAVPVGTGVSQIRNTYAQPLTLLLGIAGMVLVIACGNLANLMLARASVRQSEMAVRLAIGASRRRLIRQLMVESLLIAFGGAVAGTLVAGALGRVLVTFLDNPSGRRVFVDLGIDWTVLAFTAGLAALTCLLFGLAPAFRATRTHPAQIMRASGRGLTDGRDRFNLRRVLVITQLALSLVLITGALLFGGTLRNLINVDTGFTAAGVTTLDIDFRNAGIAEDQRLQYQLDLIKKLEAVPGVTSVASSYIVPLTGSGWNQNVVVEGKELTPYTNITRVSPRFFEVMKMPIVSGRNFDERDTLAAPQVAIVTASFAKTYFQAPAPLGREFRLSMRIGAPDPTYTIIGVVPDIKYEGVSDPTTPVVFFAHAQEREASSDMSVVLRSNGDANAAITQLARGVHPRMLLSFGRLDEIIGAQLVRERLMATLSGFFGVVAMILAAVGLYGVMSYVVERRRSEIGIRIALGAAHTQVISMFMRESAWLIGIGLTAGVGLAFFAARYAATLLFGMTPKDPLPFVLATTFLGLVALAAAFVPARRASRQSPTTALRG